MGARPRIPSRSHRFVSMNLAEEIHKGHTRRVSGEPYLTHVSEVVALVATAPNLGLVSISTSVAWLHDALEMSSHTEESLVDALFTKGVEKQVAKAIVEGVVLLTDTEKGTSHERLEAKCRRLEKAHSYIQTIKLCDIYSNIQSMVRHDPKYWPVYRAKCLELATRLTKGDFLLRDKVLKFLNENQPIKEKE